MAGARMHDGEVAVDERLVRRLLRAQFPQWAELPLRRVASAGTVNAIYRLGGELAVRLPIIAQGATDIAKEHWLARLAPQLPLAIPKPVAHGEPADGYPWPWAVHTWLPGDDAATSPPGDDLAAAADLAAFVAALHRIDPAGAPPGRSQRQPLDRRDADVRRAVTALDGEVHIREAAAAWEGARRAPAWDGPAMWTHGDLLPTNLLVEDGRVTAVLDFGAAGAGDPAVDMLPAWAVLGPAARAAFRQRLAPDDATWERGRGWALFVALVGLPYYRHTNPGFARMVARMLDQVLAG